jgi:hypothetical protein
MAIRLIPREASFDGLLEGLSARLPRASAALASSGEPPGPDEANEAVWHLVERLDKTFLTPFDREDLYRLADALARAEEAVVESVRRISGHESGRDSPGIGAAITAIGECSTSLDEAVRGLPSLESRGDDLRGRLRTVDRRTSEAGRAIRGVDDRPGHEIEDLAAILLRRDLRAALGRALDALRDAGRAATVIVVKGA